MSNTLEVLTFPSVEISPEFQRQMPDHIEPGSMLAFIRCSLSPLWAIVEAVGLGKNPALYGSFYRHLNEKHFGK